MSWQLAAFALLAVGLLGGFVWYERTKPDARLVALVGTLAAFGALGRIAFAAVPNVKPTTDIVLVAGYALGGAPGFVVGAVSALTSNFFFGQGPWTPWQMAGWGIAGLVGAALAMITRRRIRRWPLALVCFVVGFAFTAFQDFGDWVMYSGHSLSALAVIVGKGVGFDLVHAVGCLLFALAFGPALARALARFRERLTIRWLDAPLSSGEPARGQSGALNERRRGVGVLPALLVVVAASTAVGAAGASHASAAGSGSGQASTAAHRHSPISYLEGAENRDGGLGMAAHTSSSTMVSGWAVLALATSSGLQEYVHGANGGKTPVHYLVATVKQDGGAGAIERTVLALAAAGVNLRDVGGVDLSRKLKALVGPNGSVQGLTNLTAFGVLALRAAELPVPGKTITWLLRQQDGDGGFNFETGGKTIPSDPDDTGAVLEALARTGNRAAVARAVAYLRRQQNRDGGFPDEGGASSNAQSTAFAVQGLVAAGVSPTSVHRAGATPLQYLDSLIRPDGAIDYSRAREQTPAWVTAEAQLALAQMALPLRRETHHRATTGTPRSGGATEDHAGTAVLAVELGDLASMTGQIERIAFSLIRIY